MGILSWVQEKTAPLIDWLEVISWTKLMLYGSAILIILFVVGLLIFWFIYLYKIMMKRVY